MKKSVASSIRLLSKTANHHILETGYTGFYNLKDTVAFLAV
jgi:hypothetical protein